MDGGWVALPYGVPLTLQRRLVEVLARDKIRHYDFRAGKQVSYVTMKTAFMIIKDPCEWGVDWFKMVCEE